MNKKHVGSSFDEFLETEGILSDVDSAAVEKVVSALKNDAVVRLITNQAEC